MLKWLYSLNTFDIYEYSLPTNKSDINIWIENFTQ